MKYWDIRKKAAKIIPRAVKLFNLDTYKQKEKGRKSNYEQFNIENKEMVKIERLLNTEEINSFAEVSLRAQSCPMPFNIDLWDGLKCPHQCAYCYADYFRHSLYTSFFDNSKEIGLRHCSEAFYKKELDKILPRRGEEVSGENAVINAVRLGIPLRLGIRFDDFHAPEKATGISLGLLKYLAGYKYPVMINTKSDLVGAPEYVKALSDNEAGAAVHITMITSDEDITAKMEPGAPSFKKRVLAGKNLTEAGVRVVARIEPWIMFLTDEKDKVDEYIGTIKEAGIKHLTFDSYSYSAYSKGIAQNFYERGWDFERMFKLSSDSQWLSSYFLGSFIDYFRENGLECSTFDQGNVPDNDDWICCSVGDFFGSKGAGFNYGSGVIAIKFIQSRKGKPVSWGDFEKFVIAKGGWLTTKLRQEVKMLWNSSGDAAWHLSWAKGLKAIGHDQDGIIWCHEEEDDFRKNLFESGVII